MGGAIGYRPSLGFAAGARSRSGGIQMPAFAGLSKPAKRTPDGPKAIGPPGPWKIHEMRNPPVMGFAWAGRSDIAPPWASRHPPPPASNRKFSPSTKPEIVLAPLTPSKMRILPPESGEVHSAQSPEPELSAFPPSEREGALRNTRGRVCSPPPLPGLGDGCLGIRLGRLGA